MTISIVIPTLNEAERIGPLVRFLLRHGGPVVAEILVIDGGSRDGTPDVAAAAGATVIASAPGRAVQMNTGAAAARSPILYFVHADTQPPESFASDIRQALADGWPMGCFRYRFDSPSLMLKINSWFTRFHWLWCQGGDKTFFIKNELFTQLGGYNEQLVIMEEYDFLIRAQAAGKPFTVLPKNALVSARKYEGRTWLQVQVANFTVFNLWRFRLAQPATLKRLYAQLLEK
jgi:rSAM/selenodomain-associated transferase 2